MSLKLTEQKSSCRFIWRSVSYLLKAKFLRRAFTEHTMQKKLILLTVILALASGCSSPEETHVFTLYGNLYMKTTFRDHIATFDNAPTDATDKAMKKIFADENWERCQTIARLLTENWKRSMIGVKDAGEQKFWCEKGRYRQ